MAFDIKLEDFQRKACLVARDHKTNTMDAITYSSVVTRETVWNALIMVASHDLEVKAADMLSTYVMAYNKQDMDNNAGKSAIMVRSLYSLKSWGALFKAHHAQCMQELGYYSCDANPVLWMKAE